LGFIPLNDAATLIVAHERGLFAAEGLNVELSRDVSWATVRDKIAFGALDGAHMLAPLALAMTLGVAGAGAEPVPVIAPFAMALNGPTITLASRLAVVAGDGRRADGLARLIARRRQEGASPITLAVVFPFSTHNYLLRDWLAAAGIDPDRDVRLTVAPPPRMNELLAGGVVEGFCVTEPWGSAAAAVGSGRIVARGADLWPRTPDKVFAVTKAWAAERPNELQALLRAMLRAAAWADDAENRAELAAMLAQPRYVGADVAVIEASLPDVIFAADGATAPQPLHAAWLLTQMARWSQIVDEVNIAAAARGVYRPELHAAARAALGLSKVSTLESLEAFCEGGFRLAGLFPPK
jgi:NitT/TauT family transport system ATP-binding protein/nitrate/nitrite transport system substrate-binding protein